MKKWIFVPVLALLLAFLPGIASADDDKDQGFLLRVNGDFVLPAGETIDSLVVIDGDALIEGTVLHNVMVVDGNATVSGSVSDNVTVISGDLNLQSGAQVNNVSVVRGVINRQDNVVVTGHTDERTTVVVLPSIIALFSVVFWLGMTLAVIAAGLIFAAVGGRQLREAAQAMTGDVVNSVLGMVGLWVAVPLVAVVAVVTIVGLPLGLGLLLFLLPALWLLGYIVAGTRLGLALVSRSGADAGHPFMAAFLGLLILQLLVIVPVLGGLIAAIAGVWGAGSLAAQAFRAAGGKGFSSQTPTSGSQPLPAA